MHSLSCCHRSEFWCCVATKLPCPPVFWDHWEALSVDVLSIAVATNNIQYPSVKVTKSYNNKQRVYFGSKVLDLQGAVKQNVKTFLKYYKEKWSESKYDLLLGPNPPHNVPMTLAKTFTVIAKYHTTYKNHGILMSWIDRNECHDMKHPHHIFLLQNILDKMTVVNVEEVRKLKFPDRAKEDVDAWMHFFHLLPEETRPTLSSCLGWGRRELPKAGKVSETGGGKRSRGKKKEKKCGQKIRKRG